MPLDKLHEIQESAGAVFAQDPKAWPQALNYGDPQAEYAAAHDQSVVFDLTGRGQIQMTGADRHKFLHNFCTNAIKELPPGHGTEAFLLNAKGRIVAHTYVIADDESLWLETVPGTNPFVVTHLDRYIITEDVQLHDRTDELGTLFVTGPQAPAHMREFGATEIDWKPGRNVTVHFEGLPLSIRRFDRLGQPGFSLVVAHAALPDLWNRLITLQVRPAGADAFHAMRIEAGTPIYGADITEDNLAQEAARTQQAISFTKGCYLGQEPVARIDALGHVNRELRGLTLASADLPEAGSSVTADLQGEQVVGTITTSALSYRDKNAVALAMIRSSHVAPGTAVFVAVGDTRRPATVFWPTDH